MKNVYLIFLCFLASLSMADASDRIALLVGNDEYPSQGLFGNLDNPTKDVDLIAESLVKSGFKVIVAKNADRAQMRMKIAEFEGQIQPGGTALFYYGGHGIQYENENYLMGSNALLLKKYELSDEAIRAKVVVDAMTEKRPKSSFIFLDCCRSHPPESWLQSDTRSARTRGMASMEAPGVVISFSAAPGAEATDGAGNHSPYAKALAENILKGLEFDRVLKEIGRSVHAETNAQQRVWTNGNFLHDFYFTPPLEVGNTDTGGGLVVGGSAVSSSLPEQAIAEPGSMVEGADRAVANPQDIEQTEVASLAETSSYEPILPMSLPDRGYFRNDEIFVGSAYGEYNSYSKKNIIRKAQGLLTGAGSPDGIMGKKTQSALIEYQTENGLPITGRLDEGTLTAMNLVGIANDSAPPSRSPGNGSYRGRGSSSGGFNANNFIRNAESISRTINRFR